jgi:tripartite-type tricarboxylate transporter receptor subunit TctC
MKLTAGFKGAAFVIAALPWLAFAQQYPAKPIRATIGTPTGGPGDVVLRGAGQAIGQAFGHVVDVQK